MSEEKQHHMPVFDGFCHRDYNEDIDGWQDEISKGDDFFCVQQADSVIEMFHKLRAVQKENWKLRRDLARAEESLGRIYGGKK